jgi:hypothetical protein
MREIEMLGFSINELCSSLTDCFLEGRQFGEKLFAKVIKSLTILFGYVVPSVNELHARHRFQQ